MKVLSSLFLFTVFVSCSSVDKNLTKYRKSLAEKKYKEAKEYLEKSKIKKDPDSKLLYLMEQGMLSFHQGNYQNAIASFTEALDYRDQLYTKSISKSVKSAAFNSNFDDYLGSAFEVSLIYYFQALSYYQLSIKEKDQNKQKSLLFQVRATALAWDTYFKTLRRSKRKTNKIFIDDFFARITGANLHELLKTRREQEIALLLYQDALKVLQEIGPSLNIFNKEYKEYVTAVKDNKKSKIKIPTDSYLNLERYIQERILSLAFKLRPQKVNSLAKNFKFEDQELKELKKKAQKNHLTIMILADQMPDKVANEVNISLRGAIENSKDPGTKAMLKGFALPLITMFAARSLHLNYVTRPYGNNIYVRHNALEALTGEVGIAFDLPMYPDKDFDIHREIRLINLKTKEVITKTMVVSGPLFSLAKQDLDEEMASEYWRTGIRVALKHVAAIVAAYTLYQAELKKKESSGFGKLAILGGYYAASRGIKASEAADLRNWGSLPANILSSRFYLEPGNYSIELKNKDQFVKLGTVEITENQPAIFTAIVP